MPPATLTYVLNREQADALKSHLDEAGFKFREVPYAEFAGEKEKLNVVFYRSGKLVIQGKQAQEFVEFVLEPQILKEARAGYEEILNPELLLPRLGIDESGKGDFFGPLCIAGVYVNQKILAGWKDAGIRDSKTISSDRRMLELAKTIKETAVHSVVVVGNEAYNRLYLKLKSVNRLLAWGHARVIENLLRQKHLMDPPPVKAISDQFAYTKATVESALMELGRGLELVQRHKAESDLAVAAASILAREAFITRMASMGKTFGMEFPRGASAAVESAARDFLAKAGAKRLGEVSKLHFRTAFRVQGLPEPPRQEWKRPPAKPRESDF